MTIGIDPSVLLAWYQSSSGGAGAGTGSSTSAPAIKYAPTAPWNTTSQPKATKLVQTALGGQPIFNPNAAKLDLAGANADYKSLFALYQGLQTLYDVANQAGSTGVSSFQVKQLSAAFASGLTQLNSFVGTTHLNSLRLTTGTTTQTETSTNSTPAQPTQYDTAAINLTGDSNAVVPAFQGQVQFDVNVAAGSNNTTVHMDLSEMGATPRTMANVLAYLNGKMQAAGAIASFSSNPMPAKPEIITIGGKPVTINSGTETWGLQLNTDPFEAVTLSAPQTAPAVYVGQVAGNQSASIGGDGKTIAPDAQSQLLKFQVGGTAITPPNPGANAAPDQVFKDALGANVTSIQDTVTAADGSVYVLANTAPTPPATGTTAPATASTSGQDVSLLHYDSAGNLLFQTQLGADSNAGGLSLAVSADGTQVAVAGQVTGPLTAGATLENPTGTNSFVAVFDSQGDQVWSQEKDGIAGNRATGVAFGADGSLYVTGQTATTVGQALTPAVDSNGYFTVYSSAGKQLASTQFGSGGVNAGSAIAVDGTNVYVAGTQNGHAVINQYDVSTPSAPTLTATRDLGDLQGGNIAGVAVQNGTVYVAGATHNGALAAGSVTSAYSGGLDAFAATLSTGLAPAGSDAVAYYGGAGDDTVTGMAVSNGEVFLTGSSTGALPGQAAIGAKDGFVAQLNVAAGSVDWSQRFTGLDGQVAPTSIAVAASGSSILDQLGLPQGVVDGPVSNLLTATGSIKVGDSFGIATNGAGTQKITIAAGETMASLAEKITRATGATVSVSLKTTASSTELVIKPLDPFATVTLTNGPAGHNALTELGLKAGILYQTTKHAGASVPADGKGQVFGLGLDATLDLTSTTNINHAKSQLTAAMSVVKSAYQALANAATPPNVLALQKAQASGKAPAYLTSQIASYQSALAHLTAGQTSTTSVGA